MNIKACLSKQSDNWETPPAFIGKLAAEFGEFQLDPCPLFAKFDGLKIPWCG